MKTRNELANDYHNRLPEGPFEKSFVHGAFVDGYDAGYQAAKEKYEAKIKEQADTLAGMEDECEGLKTIIYDKDETNLLPPAKWISVYERMPEKNKKVKVLINYFLEGTQIREVTEAFFRNGLWSGDGVHITHPLVSHWMPLPKPPEEK